MSGKKLAADPEYAKAIDVTVGEAMFLNAHLPKIQGILQFREARKIMDKIQDFMREYDETLTAENKKAKTEKADDETKGTDTVPDGG